MHPPACARMTPGLARAGCSASQSATLSGGVDDAAAAVICGRELPVSFKKLRAQETPKRIADGGVGV